MTRHLLTPYPDAAVEVVVGFDRPLDTYFAQVITQTPDGEDELLVWKGALERIPEPHQVLDAVRPYAPIPAALRQQLFADPQLADQNITTTW